MKDEDIIATLREMANLFGGIEALAQAANRLEELSDEITSLERNPWAVV